MPHQFDSYLPWSDWGCIGGACRGVGSVEVKEVDSLVNDCRSWYGVVRSRRRTMQTMSISLPEYNSLNVAISGV